MKIELGDRQTDRHTEILPDLLVEAKKPYDKVL